MGRSTRKQTDANRVAIEEVSSKLFRERGIKGVSVADLMAAVGLTHGGFYSHFESKDALAAAACTKAFEQSIDLWKRRSSSRSKTANTIASLADGYLSACNRDEVGTGCTLAGLATDVSREPPDKPIHGAFVAGMENLLAVILSNQAKRGEEARRDEALVAMSTLVGAMVLARATRGATLSDELLEAVRAGFQADGGKGGKQEGLRRNLDHGGVVSD